MTDVKFAAAAVFDRKFFWEGGESVCGKVRAALQPAVALKRSAR